MKLSATVTLACVVATASVGVLGQGAARSGSASSTDWPQWQGPDRNGLSSDRGLLQTWPASGPPLIWSVSGIGAGYGSIAVKGDRIFVQGSNRGQSIVFSLNRADGKNMWSKAIGSAGSNEQGDGPRGTPTVEDDRVYVLTENGDLACLKAQDGTAVWQRNILRDFGGRNIGWLISESPLIDGGRVIVSPGGRGAGIVALDKTTGQTVWMTKELSDEAGYSSPVAVDVQGVRIIMTLTGEAAVGVRASDGKLMWRYTRVANRTANVTTPVFFDNKAFFTTAYGMGAALLGLSAQAGEVKAQEIYFTSEFQNHHGGVVLHDGYLYGFSNSILMCIDFATGKTLWRNRSVGKGSLTYADGRLYLLGEDHVVGLADAVPTGYMERGRFKIADQGLPSWAHPVVVGGRLYIRNQGTLAAYDVKGG